MSGELTGVDLIGTYNAENREDVAYVKAAATTLIDEINNNVPPGRRRSIALTHVEEAAMMAVKAIFEG